MNENSANAVSANPFSILNLTFSVLNVEYLSTSSHPEIHDSALSYQPQSRDVILSSYLKCDNKNIEIFLWKLLRGNTEMPPINSITNRYLPCYETVGIKQASVPLELGPRLLKTHLPYQMVPRYSKVKYIYIVRNPWDAIVSCYRSIKRFASYDETFDCFFNRFIEGKLGYGNYFSHIASWYKHVEDNNVLVLSYEVIKSEPRSTLFTVASFLGEDYLNFLLECDDAVQDILSCCINKKNQRSTIKALFEKSSFTVEQSNHLADKIEEHLKNTGIENHWKRLLEDNTSKTVQKEELKRINERLNKFM